MHDVADFLGLEEFDFLPTVEKGRYNVEVTSTAAPRRTLSLFPYLCLSVCLSACLSVYLSFSSVCVLSMPPFLPAVSPAVLPP